MVTSWGEKRNGWLGEKPAYLRGRGSRVAPQVNRGSIPSKIASNNIILLGARAYSPTLGRFLSADSIVPEPGNPQDLNRYSYVRGNPLRYTDPSGHEPCETGVGLYCLGGHRYEKPLPVQQKPALGPKPKESVYFANKDEMQAKSWSDASTIAQHVATGLSLIGATMELGGGLIGAVSGVGLGPTHTVEGLAGFAVGAAQANIVYRTYINPVEDTLGLAAAVGSAISDSLLGKNRIDKYEDHWTLVIGQDTYTAATTAFLGAASVTAVTDLAINGYSSVYSTKLPIGPYDLTNAYGKSDWVIGPWLQLQAGDTP